MAGDWLKIEKETPEKPEVYRIAEFLGISQADAFLACFRVWRWADSQTEDGTIRTSQAAIDDNAKVPNFHMALREVGWLNLRTGSVELPNFVRHMGKSAKQRALAADRMLRSRSDQSATKAQPEKEKIREETKTKNPPYPPLPFSSEAFRDAWEKWLEHMKQKRKRPTAASVEGQFREFLSWGESRSIAALIHSRAKNWASIYEPSVQSRQQGPASREGDLLREIKQAGGV